jgi:hypothetical protein
MPPDPRVIAELRALFKAGATPSRLVRHVVAEHGTGPDTDWLVRAYFREGFGVPMFRASASLLTLPPEQLAFAGVTPRTLHQMVECRGEWDTEGGVGPSWLDTLPVAQPAGREETPETATARHLYEERAILSRLVEQLQQQVTALEQERDERRALPHTARIDHAA